MKTLKKQGLESKTLYVFQEKLLQISLFVALVTATLLGFPERWFLDMGNG